MFSAGLSCWAFASVLAFEDPAAGCDESGAGVLQLLSLFFREHISVFNSSKLFRIVPRVSAVSRGGCAAGGCAAGGCAAGSWHLGCGWQHWVLEQQHRT